MTGRTDILCIPSGSSDVGAQLVNDKSGVHAFDALGLRRGEGEFKRPLYAARVDLVRARSAELLFLIKKGALIRKLLTAQAIRNEPAVTDQPPRLSRSEATTYVIFRLPSSQTLGFLIDMASGVVRRTMPRILASCASYRSPWKTMNRDSGLKVRASVSAQACLYWRRSADVHDLDDRFGPCRVWHDC